MQVPQITGVENMAPQETDSLRPPSGASVLLRSSLTRKATEAARECRALR